MSAIKTFTQKGEIPMFPLPGLVFFPGTVLPLHVFEERYRAMVRAAVRGEGLLAMALLRPGWEGEYEGRPPVHPVGTIGRIENLESLPDGRFNLSLVGLQKVKFVEEVGDEAYRVVRVRPVLENAIDEKDPAVREAKIEILASHEALLREMMDQGGPGFFLDESIPFEKVVNGACANIPVDPSVKQSLLEENDLLVRQRRVAALLTQVLERVMELRARRSGSADEPTMLH